MTGPAGAPLEGLALSGRLASLSRGLAALNRAILMVSMGALVLAALILSTGVVLRYFFQTATDWQDEAAVFLLVGATFLCGAHVQSLGGHVAIDALGGVLSARVNHLRQVLVDAVSAAFCAFFAWKSWTLCHEAWAEKQTTSSTWAPPLWIPYSLMALGMTLLTLQLVVLLLVRLTRERT
ncbi:MAG: TRAP transporter small permease [Opitutaceae bacterium]|nr:TRAP transporter small permease [Opitutaceae bacterium]